MGVSPLLLLFFLGGKRGGGGPHARARNNRAVVWETGICDEHEGGCWVLFPLLADRAGGGPEGMVLVHVEVEGWMEGFLQGGGVVGWDVCNWCSDNDDDSYNDEECILDQTRQGQGR